MNQIIAYCMSPMHIFPFAVHRIMLEKHMILSIVIHQSVWVIYPASLCSKMGIRTIFSVKYIISCIGFFYLNLHIFVAFDSNFFPLKTLYIQRKFILRIVIIQGKYQIIHQLIVHIKIKTLILCEMTCREKPKFCVTYQFHTSSPCYIILVLYIIISGSY